VGESALTNYETGMRQTEVDYWIAISKKVGMKRLIHEGMSGGQKQTIVSQSSDFEVDPGVDWESVKQISKP